MMLGEACLSGLPGMAPLAPSFAPGPTQTLNARVYILKNVAEVLFGHTNAIIVCSAKHLPKHLQSTDMTCDQGAHLLEQGGQAEMHMQGQPLACRDCCIGCTWHVRS